MKRRGVPLIEKLKEDYRARFTTPALREANRRNVEALGRRAAAILARTDPSRPMRDLDRFVAADLDRRGQRHGVVAGNREVLAQAWAKIYGYRRRPGEDAEAFCMRVLNARILKKRAGLPIREALSAKVGNPRRGITPAEVAEIDRLRAAGVPLRQACYVVAGVHRERGEAIRSAYLRLSER